MDDVLARFRARLEDLRHEKMKHAFSGGLPCDESDDAADAFSEDEAGMLAFLRQAEGITEARLLDDVLDAAPEPEADAVVQYRSVMRTLALVLSETGDDAGAVSTANTLKRLAGAIHDDAMAAIADRVTVETAPVSETHYARPDEDTRDRFVHELEDPHTGWSATVFTDDREPDTESITAYKHDVAGRVLHDPLDEQACPVAFGGTIDETV